MLLSDLVTLKGIEKHFPGVHALSDVSFELKRGEVHALMGENGAGKSTLMKVLSGVYQRDSGDIFIKGQRVSPANPREAQALGIGIIHQELSLMNDLTAAQNIFIGREPRSRFGILKEKQLNKQAEVIFESMNLDMDASVLVGNLTVASQQMVEIAKALSFNSSILIMDEPTSALNRVETDELFKMIRSLKEEGVGIIYISHKMDELKQIADRVTVMRDGEYVGTVDAASTEPAEIINMMVGRNLANEAVDIPNLNDSPIALEVLNLSRGDAIKAVGFKVKKGEILGFSGLMGAGRTEVARAIFGADPKDSGDIFVHGVKHDIESPTDAVKAGIGYLSEDRKHFGLAVSMNVRANIVMACLDRYINRFKTLDETRMEKVAYEYINLLDIRTPSDLQEVTHLSGGNQQKVVIAKWLLRDCDVLIFDEPTRGIDVGAKAEIYNLLKELAAQGKAIIVISSELPEILRVCHRIAVMCEGKITGVLPGGSNTSQEQIMALATG